MNCNQANQWRFLLQNIGFHIARMMVSKDNKLAFLFVLDDEENWVIEKLALEKGRPHAIVVDPEKMTASVEWISYKIVNGGPVCLL